MPSRLPIFGSLLMLLAASTLAAAAPSRPGATLALGQGEAGPRAVPHPATTPARLIVEFTARPVATARSAATARSEHDATIARFRDDLAAITASLPEGRRAATAIAHTYFRVASGAAVTVDPSAVGAIGRLPYVRRVSPDFEVRALVEPGVSAVGADRTWAAHATRGAGVTVAVIDSGIDYRHPSLGGGFGPGFKVAGGYDFVNDDGDPLDDNGHGTHVAGIVAGNSALLLGVAPDASLLAFKVLDSSGNGQASSILAALERAADPDGDGDVSDRADVANLSLGGPGSADDPLSMAVDAAVRLGIVVCVAAGNDGAWQSIGSPGTARLALTVGAVDASGAVAPFSSRGPAPGSYGLKPDVAAPGVDVRSTAPGDAFVSMTGTSMATPHVAGVAALLRAIHPDWSADEIESRIATTANAVEAPPMTAGSGIADAFRAAGGATVVLPWSLGLGPVDLTSPTWSSSRTITLRNRGTEPVTYSVELAGARAGLAIDASATTLTVPVGESRDLTLTFTIDNAALPFPDDGSFAWDAEVVLDGGGERLTIPVAVVKGCRVRAAYDDDALVTPILLGDDGTARFMTETGERQFESMVLPGRYDVILFAMSRTGAPNALVAFEQRELAADLSVRAALSSATERLSFDARDETGSPFPPPSVFDSAGCTWERTMLLPGPANSWIATILGPSPDLLVSPLTSRVTILASEVCSDLFGSKLYSLEYAPIRGVTTSIARGAGGASLIRRPFELILPGAFEGTREISVANTLHIDGSPHAWSTGTATRLGPSWVRGTLFLGPRLDPESKYAYLAKLSGTIFDDARGVGSLTRYLHPVSGGTLFHDSKTPPPTAFVTPESEPLTIGAGSVFPALSYIGAERVVATVSYRGQLDELVMPVETDVALYDETGAKIGEGPFEVELPDGPGRCRLEARATAPAVAGRPSTVLLTATFRGTEDDPYPPTITSLILLGADGQRLTDSAPRSSAPTLRVSAIDTPSPPARATLRFRRAPDGAWSEIPLSEAGLDYDFASGHPPVGNIWEADLRAAALSNGFVDLELTFEDAAGNRAVAVIAPAFAVGAARPRPARRD